MADTDVTSTTPAARVDADLREQWDALIDWLRSLDDDVLDAPTPLPRWSVRDLVAHLGLGMRVLALAEAVERPEQDEPTLTFADYLAGYAPRAAHIRAEAADLAAGEDPVGAAEETGRAALATLDRLRGQDARLVRVRRGVVPLDTLVLTRLIELVVHADDLSRSAAIPSPVDPTALTIVARALLALLRSRTGENLEVGDELTWLRLATGRLPWSGRGQALRPGALADGLPDLRQALPLVG